MDQLFNTSLEKNVGTADKVIRATVASSMIGAACSKKISTTGKVILALGAAMLLATSLTGKCPAYQAAGIDTRNYDDE
ncbi:DUF2892 domain-containing protein [Haoranjiania flava]|uniref:DUF2892 domain-containing protein n=1 Tax=Haoranjiania flava TaxID=1856322 RepID=A0AAE3IM66_9BACT|nr:DUF2892 domain-containing protein [Haoranjiania flava]MCU7694458.1 DUF2892 domain-containing protein [Haoranjiania flava]